jgi:hypothetical protein
VTSIGSFSLLHIRDTFGENYFPIFEVLIEVYVYYLFTNFEVLRLGNVWRI